MRNHLTCPPFGDVPVEWDGETLGAEAALRANIGLVEEIWPEIWPAIHEAIAEVVREYEHQKHFGSAAKRLVICVPGLKDDPEAQWTVAVHTDPSVGIYEVKIQGSTVSDAGATF